MYMHPLRLSLFALLFLAVFGMSGEADAGSVEVYVNDSEDLVTSEEGVTIPYGNFILTFHVGGPYRIESGDDNFSAYSINVDVHFLSDEDRRDTCTMCAIPNLKPLGDTDKDPGYDTYQATFFSDMMAFEGYSGNIQFSIIIKNRTSSIVWDDVFEVTIGPASSGDSGSSGFSTPELSDVIQENLLVIGGGLLVILVVGTIAAQSLKKEKDLYALPKSGDNYSINSHEAAEQAKTSEKPEVSKGMDGVDNLSKLKDLRMMYKEGLIDENEFKKLKSEILD